MADVVLFHHVLGVTPGLRAIADELRAHGHSVAVPDLFEGEVFDSIDAGVQHAEHVGFDLVTQRGVAAVDGHNEAFVVIGFSLGVLPAQKLAQTHTGVVGAVLCHAAIPVAMFGDGWPEGVAVQLHLVEDDPFAAEDLDAAREVAEAASGGELFMYPGSGHLVADASASDYDEIVGRQIIDRIVAFVDELS